MTGRCRGKNTRCRADDDDVDARSIKSLRLFENDIDILVLRAAAQQEHVRSFQDLEEWNFGPAGIPPQRVLMAVGRDEDLFESADPVLHQHLRGKIFIAPNGHEHALRWDASRAEIPLLKVLKRPYVLLLGSSAKHKNVDVILKQAQGLY